MESGASAPSAAAAPAPAPRRLDILLADDDADIREIATLALQRDGRAEVRSCGDGAAALNAVRAARPDLLVLDVMMPGLDGRATMAELRRLHPNPPPVIFLTAKAMPEELEQLRQLGARHIITKPFDPMKLLDEVLVSLGQTDVR